MAKVPLRAPSGQCRPSQALRGGPKPPQPFAEGLLDPETGRIARPTPYTFADRAWLAHQNTYSDEQVPDEVEMHTMSEWDYRAALAEMDELHEGCDHSGSFLGHPA